MMERLKRIHRTSLRILDEIGIRLHQPDILAMLRGHGVRVVGATAFFTESQIEKWVGLAPERFSMQSPSGRHDMRIGGDKVEYAAGYGAPLIVDWEGLRRSTRLDDYLTFLKLVHQVPYFKLNGGILVQPGDVPPEQSAAVMMYAAITHSDKCLMGIPGTARDVEHLMQMVALTCGGIDHLEGQHRVLTMVSTLSPLQIDRTALETMMVSARYCQPLIISPSPAAGTTGPVMLAGNLALANAEALAAITIAQMLQPGLPVIYGLQSNVADMRSGQVSIGSPGYALQVRYCAELARMYRLPSRSGGCNTDAKQVCVQSGYEAMLSMLTACQSGINLIVHSAGILDAYAAMSYEQFIIDVEIISMLEYLLADLKTEPEDFAFDLIQQVGIGGQFLATAHTAKHCRTQAWSPRIGLRGGRLREATPDLQYRANVNREVERLLGSYRRPDLPAAVATGLRDYLTDVVGVDGDIVAQISRPAPARATVA